MIDYIILFPLVLWLAWSNHLAAKRENYSHFQTWFLQALLLYHIFFSMIFYQFILHFGGDAIRYWNLTADISRDPSHWWDHLGTGTFFIQWINYVPSEILGLHFRSGNILYASLSFIGIRMLYKLVNRTFWNQGNFENVCIAFVFLLPNLHFWTSGVGKEAFIFLGWVLFLTAIQFGRKYWIYGCFGIILLFMTRPITGLLGLLIGIIAIFFSKDFDKSKYWYILILGLILGSGMFYWVLALSHLETFSWEALMKFREGQFEFLRGFKAKTEIPMEDYSLLFQVWTLYFRPFWNDVMDFLSFTAALENTVSMILIIAGGIALVSSSPKNMPRYLWTGLIIVLIMSGIYLLNLNNLGLMMRMKSTVMIFLHLIAVFWIISKWKYYNCERI